MKRAAGRAPVRPPRLPWLSILLMVIFQLGGVLALLLDWSPGPANLDWGVWIVIYCGYIYLIAAAFFYVKTGR